MHFTDLGLAEPLLRAVREQGYDIPTPIQAQAIPAVLQGGDLMGGAAAEFVLPTFQMDAVPGVPRGTTWGLQDASIAGTDGYVARSGRVGQM